jgi:hypothetical protein
MSIHSVCVCVGVCVYLSGQDYVMELIDIQPHTDTLYNKCKSTFQLRNLVKYGHGPPEDGFKGNQNM